MTPHLILYVQEVLPILYNNLLHKMGQDFFDSRYLFCFCSFPKYADYN